jgi:hypothetical protein
MDKLVEIVNNGEYDKIEGWCSSQKALLMAQHIKESDICVELGVFAGRSLLPIALMTKNTVYGIDAWNVESSMDGTNDHENNVWWATIDYNYFMNYTKKLLKKYNCNNVQLIKSKSEDVVYLFNDESIDVLHQDSNHSEEISCREVELFHNKVKKNGLWIFDDANWKTTQKAQQMLLNYGYNEILDLNEWKIFRRL